jgi:hypothetical protein
MWKATPRSPVAVRRSPRMIVPDRNPLMRLGGPEHLRLRSFFAGILGLSTSTADRYWAYARARLRVKIAGGDMPGP